MNRLQQFFQPGTTPCCEPPGRDQQMDILISIFAKLAGINVTCETLQELAQEYACVPRALQLPALIYLANQIVITGGGGGQANYAGNYGGQSPLVGGGVIAPTSGMVWALDTSNSELWVGSNGVWQDSGIQL